MGLQAVRFIGLGAVLGLAGAVVGGCDVRIQDDTPAQYRADNGLGMYQVKASISRPALVAPDSVFVTAFIDDKPLRLEPDASGTQWQALYSVRCHSRFALQYHAVWSVQSITTRNTFFPAHPRSVRLIEPPLTAEVKIDTSARSHKGWSGVVHYQFITAPTTKISALRIEPLSESPADRQAAEPIKVTTTTPLYVPCAMPAEITLSSSAQRARGFLVIETDDPSVPRWRTRVEFAPAA